MALLLTTLGWAAAAFAQANEPLHAPGPAEAIALSPGAATVDMAERAWLLEDRSGTATLDEVRESGAWHPSTAHSLSFGISASTWWARWTIQNTRLGQLDAVIDLGTPRQDHAQFVVLRDGGRVVETVELGDRLPYASRPLNARTLAMPLTLQAGERVEVLVRLSTYDGRFETMPVHLLDEQRFFESVERENFVFTLFHGALISLTLYNLMLYLSTRARTFALYVAFMASFFLWSFTFRGYGFQYLWPESPRLNNDLLPVLGGAMFATIGLFAIVYLRMRELVPRWAYRLNGALVVANTTVAAPVLAGHFVVGGLYGWAVGLASALTSLATAGWLLLRGQRQARFFVASFVVLAFAGGAYMLENLRVLSGTWATTWGVPFGSMLQMLLLALGLADAMNTLKADKIASEKRERDAQRRHTEQLEGQVRERTQALEHANGRLQELAITDDLTGAFNRRHFDDSCRAMLTRRPRGVPLAMCMFDVDHFKRFNDEHGHVAGDDALRAVAKAVQVELKRTGDALFRLGGEEFGVLFSADSRDAAQAFAERLRHAVRDLKLSHPGHPKGIVTASFGVAWSGSQPAGDAQWSVERLYAAADRALYAAKAAGRDRVALELVTDETESTSR